MKTEHPMTRLIYERLPDGRIRVSDKNGREGIFDRNGNWICGERKAADPLMCVWVASH